MMLWCCEKAIYKNYQTQEKKSKCKNMLIRKR